MRPPWLRTYYLLATLTLTLSYTPPLQAVDLLATLTLTPSYAPPAPPPSRPRTCWPPCSQQEAPRQLYWPCLLHTLPPAPHHQQAGRRTCRGSMAQQVGARPMVARHVTHEWQQGT